ncbi:hypothetical protein MRX96_046247 [Rhipicephalus microplus]
MKAQQGLQTRLPNPRSFQNAMPICANVNGARKQARTGAPHGNESGPRWEAIRRWRTSAIITTAVRQSPISRACDLLDTAEPVRPFWAPKQARRLDAEVTTNDDVERSWPHARSV